jgi:hypothetical protein
MTHVTEPNDGSGAQPRDATGNSLTRRHPTANQSSPGSDAVEDEAVEQITTPKTSYFGPGGNLRPFRLLKTDLVNLKGRYLSDWTVFNQQIVASSIYIFFTNLLPGITFASDLYSLTGQSWGTIEIVLSTGLCGIIFALYARLSH